MSQIDFVLKELNLSDKDIQVEIKGQGVSIIKAENGWQIQIENIGMLGHALAMLQDCGNLPSGQAVCQQPAYTKLGIMLDVSRNAVPTVSTLKQLIRILALMGYNLLQLYMEDIYTLEQCPYFGYGRGAYSDEELTAIDEYAAQFGIEVVPAIQTLAHLGQSLKWDAMRSYVDFGDILLCDDEQTYTLIEAMISKMRKCFRTSSLNIGMDEAHMIGLGEYLNRHGYTDRTELLLRHFGKVHDIARKYGFKPMMWSDMFFRLATGGEYYNPDCAIDPKVARQIPDDTSLVYWDYYGTDPQKYDSMFSKHLQLTPNIVFACGAWKWSGYSPCNHFSLECAKAAHPICRKYGIDQVLVTMWGDNGAECSLFAVLPVLQYWAELNWYGCADDPNALRRHFSICTGGNWDDFMALDEPVFTPDNPAPGRCAVNASKSLLYEDVLMPLFSNRMDLPAYTAHLSDCIAMMEKAVENTPWRWLFENYLDLCKLLAKKCQTRIALRTAWKTKDAAALQQVCENLIPDLIAAVQAFTDTLHVRWLQENKAAGMDVLDLRLGGLIQRCRTASERINTYLQGKADTVEELDMELLPFSAKAAANGFADAPAPFWHNLVSPSCIAMI